MEVKISKQDHFGRGLTFIDNKICFVDKALPNEIVDIDIVSEKKNYLEGKINKIIVESNKRIKPICPYYDKCGGCSLLHQEYSEQLEFKKDGRVSLAVKVTVKKGLKVAEVCEELQKEIAHALEVYVESVPFEIEISVDEIK